MDYPEGLQIFRRRALFGSVCSSAVFAFLLFAGRCGIPPAVYTSNFYDVQARSFFHGTVAVPLNVFTFEAFKVNGRFVSYFGPVPALLRMPILLVTSRFDGRLAPFFLFFAFVTLLWGVSRLQWNLRLFLGSPPSRWTRFTAGLVPFGVGVGWVYHW